MKKDDPKFFQLVSQRTGWPICFCGKGYGSKTFGDGLCAICRSKEKVYKAKSPYYNTSKKLPNFTRS